MPSTVPVVEKSEAAESSTALPDDRRQTVIPGEVDGRKTAGENRLRQAVPGLQNASQVGKRLGTSLLVLITILLAASYLTLDRMQRMNASARDTSNESLLELRLGQEALRYSSENSRITMQVFLMQRQEVIDELLGRRAENTRKIATIISALEPLCESAEEKRLLIQQCTDAAGGSICSTVRDIP